MKKQILILICSVFSISTLFSQTYDWVSAIGAGGSDIVNGMDYGIVPGTGTPYIWVTGYTSGNFTCSPGYTLVAGAFVASYDVSGNCVWAKNIKKEPGVIMTDGTGFDIALNGSDLYICGQFSSSSKLFVTKFDAMSGIQDLVTNGVYYASSDYAGFPTAAYGLDVDGTGVYITGFFSDNIRFPATAFDSGTGTGTVITKTGGVGTETYMLKLDHNLNKQFIKRLVTNYDSEGRDIVIGQDGTSYVTGSFGKNTAADGTTKIPIGAHSYQTVTTNGHIDIFVAKFSNSTGLAGLSGQWIRNAGSALNGADNDKGSGIDVDQTFNVYVTGTLEGTATFDALSLTVTTGPDAFVAKYNPSGTIQWVVNPIGGTSGNLHGYGIHAPQGAEELCYVVGNEFFSILNRNTGAINATLGIGLPAGGVEGQDVRVTGGATEAYFVGQEAVSSFLGTAVDGAYGGYDGYVTRLDISGLRQSSNDIAEDTWSLFPNPTTGNFILIANELYQNADVMVFNLRGDLIYTTSMHEHQISIDLEDKPAGIYLVRVMENGNEVYNTKFEVIK